MAGREKKVSRDNKVQTGRPSAGASCGKWIDPKG